MSRNRSIIKSTAFFRPEPNHKLPDLTIHNLSSFRLTPDDMQVLAKGLNFAPTPTTPFPKVQKQIFHSFNEFAKSLRLKYKRAHCTHQRQHHKSLNPTTTSNVYRKIKFLPPPTIESPQARYTGIAHLEKYIDDSKDLLATNLETVCINRKDNLTTSQRTALYCLKKNHHSVTIKPADKNLGIVLMNTNDYIQQCIIQLSDIKTYKLVAEYPANEIQSQLSQVLISFKSTLESFNKRLYKFLINNPDKPLTPRFYGLPKIHKQFTQLPPVRPIVSQTLARLTPSAKLIDHLLQPLAQSYPDYLHNSSSLSQLLQDLQIPDDAILVTVDVTSLYPSIPQSECLNIVHNEMCAHPDLIAINPNAIIQLLHVNVNYNYFTFAGLNFQQIKGTAMGAAFSPTVANIYMSKIIKQFLQTQSTTPFLLLRYIDDIFIIWNNTIEELETFLGRLNSFNPNLKFTHEFSSTSIDFLDLTIFKGNCFNVTNLLDTKTYQKPQNLYQYLHFSSTHSPKIFKAIIRGECIRFVRTNTTPEGYAAIVHLFKQRLHRRGYPKALIDKTTSSVKYNKRISYLSRSQRPRPTCSPPLLKCLPQPQFSLLRKVVLQDYAKLRFTSPRFISLRHPTLQNILVKAILTPTDEQLIDIHLQLGSPVPSVSHTETATLPVLHHQTLAIKPCLHPKCATCKFHLMRTNTFKSKQKNSNTFRIRHQFSCSTKNIVYLITCMKCKKQYVGHTTKQLNTRINHHRSNILNKKPIYVAQHFNLPNHSILDLKVQPIDKATDMIQPYTELLRLEAFWIKTLCTKVPEGLNVSPGVTSA